MVGDVLRADGRVHTLKSAALVLNQAILWTTF